MTLRYDMAGRTLPPTRRESLMGGEFNRNGTPTGFSVVTGSGTTTANNGDVSQFVNRANDTPGIARVQGPVIALQGALRAMHLKALIAGGGSSATSGNTRTHLRVGFLSDNGNDGALIEYLSPAVAGTGTFLVGRAANVVTRTAINYQCNNPAERYSIDVWVSRMGASQWQVSMGEGGIIRHVHDFAVDEIVLTSVRPIVEWDWTGPTGSFQRQIAELRLAQYWEW